MSVLDLLAQIRKRPGMYLGVRSAIRLHSFIQGWLLGLASPPNDVGILSEFQQWVAVRHGIPSSHSWADIITFFSESDVEAFEKFYQYLDEFMKGSGQRGG